MKTSERGATGSDALPSAWRTGSAAVTPGDVELIDRAELDTLMAEALAVTDTL